MAVIARRAARVIQRGEWPENKTHGLWRAECMIDWLKAEGIELVDADQHRGAVSAERERWLRWAVRRTCCEAGLINAPDPCPWHDAATTGGQ